MNHNNLDRKARAVAKQYKKFEQELLGLIIKIDQSKAFYNWGFSSLYKYLTEALEFSPAVASAFINVARKSQQVPELRQQVELGKLSIYKAQRITPVITTENSKIWLDLAEKKTHRELEREVAISSPKQAINEKIKYVPLHLGRKEKVTIKRNIPRIELQLGVSEKLMLLLRRAQDLESQRNKKNLNLEETLEEVLSLYLAKRDPVTKAQRQKAKGKLRSEFNQASVSVPRKKEAVNCTHRIGSEPNKISADGFNSQGDKVEEKCCSIDKNHARAKVVKREVISAKLRHLIQLRDGGQCTHIEAGGNRCSSRRFLEIHHIRPVSKGGKNTLSNLTLLCSGHHKVIHKT